MAHYIIWDRIIGKNALGNITHRDTLHSMITVNTCSDWCQSVGGVALFQNLVNTKHSSILKKSKFSHQFYFYFYWIYLLFSQINFSFFIVWTKERKRNQIGHPNTLHVIYCIIIYVCLIIIIIICNNNKCMLWP